MAGDQTSERAGGESTHETEKDGLTDRATTDHGVATDGGTPDDTEQSAETRELLVVGETSEPVTYEVTVTGGFERSKPTYTVEGTLADERETHEFRGTVTYLAVRGGPVSVQVDGEPVDPTTVG